MRVSTSCSSEPAGRERNQYSRWQLWFIYVGLFLLIVGAKLWLINAFGNPTPYWDQWDSEAGILRASLDGTLSIGAFFKAHNEHHIVFSQLFTWVLYKVDGQWDSILEMVAETPLHAGCVVLFVALAGSLMRGASGAMAALGRAGLAVFAAAFMLAPFAWENTLWGDQSCFFFSVFFGVLSIWLCWRHDALSRGWWVGTLVAFANLFALASGTFYAAAITMLLAARWLFEKEGRRKNFIAVAILAAITVIGVLITPHLNTPNTLIAPNLGAFLRAFADILSWPCDLPWACVVLQAPLVILSILVLLKRVSIRDGRWFVIIIGAALWVQAAGTAYRRCLAWWGSRYCDCWAILLFVNCACIYFLAESLPARRRGWIYPLMALWLGFMVCGTLEHAVSVLPDQLSKKRNEMFQMENNVRQYLITGDSTWLNGKVPFPKLAILKPVLDSPAMRNILPSNIWSPQPPLVPANQKAVGTGYVQDGYPSGVPKLSKITYGCFIKTGTNDRSGITLDFTPPIGTRAVDLQVAGYPNVRGMGLKVETHRQVSRSIAPALDPGYNWETITITLDPKNPEFKISAKDQSSGSAWLAFSMPNISTVNAPGRWARWLCEEALYIFGVGITLLIIGAIAEVASKIEE